MKIAIPILVLSLCFACVLKSEGQTAAVTLRQVKKLYVEPFGQGEQAAQLRQALIKRLQKSGGYKVVNTADEAEASVRGSGRIWVEGYFAINTRAPEANPQAQYAGYLSVEILAKNGEPLWSYLVTPGKFIWTNVSDDMAASLVKKMVMARADTTQEAATPTVKLDLQHASLSGAGATFAAPLYRLWFQSFERLHPEIKLTYQAVGSEAGLRMLAASGVDFAASDASPGEMGAGLPADQYRRVASALGGVVPIYRIAGLTQELKFTADVLANIYLGKVTLWNDPSIQSLNKSANLPAAPIVVLHRADGSGTTFVWSDFLSKTNADWKDRIGRGSRLNWPVGIGADGNEGVATAVEKTPNSIGYVELVYAVQHQLSFGLVRNSSGADVRATLDSLAEAARSTSVTTEDLYPSITNAPGKDAYPISTFTWLLVPRQIDDPAKKAALHELIRWMIHSGQKECSALAYAPLPRDIAEQELKNMLSW